MKKILTLSAMAVFAAASFAELKLNSIFSSNMVLQQQKPIVFFGTSDKGTAVNVEFHGKTVTAQTDENGKWQAVFPAMNAGKTNYTVKISDGKKKIELKDVLIGEVWFCSGQSNMQMPIAKEFRKGWSAQNCKQEVANANHPEIRYAHQKNVTAHQKTLPAQYAYWNGWVKCEPKNADRFSAAAYFFGRKLNQDLDVPIGLIAAAWGGTPIQPWISLDGYKAAGLKKDLAKIERFKFDENAQKAFEERETKRYAEEMKKWHQLFEKAGYEAKINAQGWNAADFDDSSWKKATYQYSPKYIVRWYRTKFKLPNWLKNKEATLIMAKGGDKVDIYLNGKKISGWEADAPEKEKKVRITLKPEQLNQDGENFLAVRGEYFYKFESRLQMLVVINYAILSHGRRHFNLNKNWKMNDEFACTKEKTDGKEVPSFINIPYKKSEFQTVIYNGMVDPWTKFPVRGVIWYQGESNAGQWVSYYQLLKTLISDWRTKWNNPEMPFIIVQIAGFTPAKNWRNHDPNKPSSWAFIRDIQQKMLNIPNVGLASAIDLGEVSNIHPANKQDVGKRLALEAERIAYGKDIVSRGPLFESAKPEGDMIRVSFKYADKGLKTSDGKAPGAFAVAGADRKFVWADARIDGKSVVVSSPKVKAPKYVRYAFADYRGDCNLQNAEGLPAYPFRSDAIDYSQLK